MKENKIKKIIMIMRIKHYIKNLLIFAPIIFGGKLFDYNSLILLCFGFLSFSILASLVYIINDIKDVESDRNHPVNMNRPIASGMITLKETNVVIIVLLMIIVFLDSLIIIMYHPSFHFVIYQIVYIVINLLYSYGLKRIPIIDVSILVLGYIIRVIYGGSLVEIEISNWLYLTVMSISFYMALGKRRNELIKQKKVIRESLNKYNKEFLNKFMSVFLVLSVVFYSLWCVLPETIVKYGNKITYTIPIIIIMLMKYSLDLEEDNYGDPVDVLTHDKTLILLSIMIFIILLLVLYL